MTAPDLTPGSPDWMRYVTGSKVAAIVGLSPWESPFSLWHRMKGLTPPSGGSKATERGNYLEAAILAWWRDQHPEHSPQHYSEQVRLSRPDLPWAFSTIDAETMIDGAPTGVEAKSAARNDNWGKPGTDEIPDYYQVQIQWGMHLSNIRRVYVPVLFGSPMEFHEYVCVYSPEIGAWLERECTAFHASLGMDTPPPLDDSVPTFNTVKALHPDIEERHAEVPLEVADTYHQAAEALTAAKAADRHAKAAMLAAMGSARYATVAGQRVARRQPAGKSIALYPVTGKDQN